MIALLLATLLATRGHIASATSPIPKSETCSGSGIRSPSPARAFQRQLSDLPIGMMVHPPSLDYFNEIARPDDVGAVLVVNTQLLPRITSGKRMVMSPSVELAEERVTEFVNHAEYFGYNIEHWPDTPTAEQSDPVAAGHAAAEFAQQHNLGYIVGPDLQFTEDAGAGLAREADIYVIQGQQLQQDISRFQAVVTTFAGAVRSGNPNVKVWVQVSSSFGTPERTLLAVEAVEEHIDGIWIHYNRSAESFAALQTLVELLRPASKAPTPTPTVPILATATPAAVVTAPKVTLPPAASQSTGPAATRPATTAVSLATSPPVSSTPEPAAEPTTLRRLSLIGGAMFVLSPVEGLVAAGGLVAFGFVLGYLWHTLRSRSP